MNSVVSLSIGDVTVLEKNGSALDRCAEVFALSTMAVSDAFVSCWKCRYDFSLMRPITYIRENIDPNNNCSF